MKKYSPKYYKLISILLIVVFCVLLRGWVAWKAETTSRDAISYISPARTISDGFSQTFKSTTRHPGYPVAIYATHDTMGWDDSIETWELSGQIVSIAFSAITLVGVFMFASLGFNWRIALIATLLFSAGRKWVHMGSDVLAEPMMTAFCVWGAYLLALTVINLKRNHAGPPPLGLSGKIMGILFGLGFLTKPEALAMLPAAFIVLAYYGFFSKRVKLKKTVVTLLNISVGFLVTALPYIIFLGRLTNRKTIDDFTITGGFKILASGTFTIFAGIDKIGEQLGLLLNPAIASLVGIGLVNGYLISKRFRPVAVSQMKLRPSGLVAFIMLAVLVSFSIPVMGQYIKHGFISHRYMAVAGCLLVGFAGAGCVTVAEAAIYLITSIQKLIKQNLIPNLIKPKVIVAVTLLLILTFITLNTCKKSLHHGKGIFKSAAADIKQIVAKDNSTIITDSPRISLYSDLAALDLPAHRPLTQNEFLNLIQTNKIKLLALSQRFIDGKGHHKVENINKILTQKRFTKLKTIQDQKYQIHILKIVE